MDQLRLLRSTSSGSDSILRQASALEESILDEGRALLAKAATRLVEGGGETNLPQLLAMFDSAIAKAPSLKAYAVRTRGYLLLRGPERGVKRLTPCTHTHTHTYSGNAALCCTTWASTERQRTNSVPRRQWTRTTSSPCSGASWYVRQTDKVWGKKDRWLLTHTPTHTQCEARIQGWKMAQQTLHTFRGHDRRLCMMQLLHFFMGEGSPVEEVGALFPTHSYPTPFEPTRPPTSTQSRCLPTPAGTAIRRPGPPLPVLSFTRPRARKACPFPSSTPRPTWTAARTAT